MLGETPIETTGRELDLVAKLNRALGGCLPVDNKPPPPSRPFTHRPRPPEIRSASTTPLSLLGHWISVLPSLNSSRNPPEATPYTRIGVSSASTTTTAAGIAIPGRISVLRPQITIPNGPTTFNRTGIGTPPEPCRPAASSATSNSPVFLRAVCTTTTTASDIDIDTRANVSFNLPPFWLPFLAPISPCLPPRPHPPPSSTTLVRPQSTSFHRTGIGTMEPPCWAPTWVCHQKQELAEDARSRRLSSVKPGLRVTVVCTTSPGLMPSSICSGFSPIAPAVMIPLCFYILISPVSLDWFEDRDNFFANDSVHRFKLKVSVVLWSLVILCTIYPYQLGPKIYKIAFLIFTQATTCRTTATLQIWISLMVYHVLVKTLLFDEKQGFPPASPKSASPRMFLGKGCSGSLAFGLNYHGGISSNLDLPMWFCLYDNWIAFVFIVLGALSGIACCAGLLLARSSLTVLLNQIWSSSPGCRSLFGVFPLLKPMLFFLICKVVDYFPVPTYFVSLVVTMSVRAYDPAVTTSVIFAL